MKFFAIALVLAAGMAAAQSTWQVISPKPPFNPGNGAFTSLAFISRSTGLAAWHGVYATVDNGATWTRDTSRTFGQNVGIAFPDSLHATTVGAAGVIAHTSDGRAHWARQTSGTTYDLAAVAFVDSLHGWAVGGGLDKNGAPHRVALSTTNGGAAWTSVIDTSNSDLTCVWMFDTHTAVFGASDGALLRTTDAGATWLFTSVAATGLHAFAFPDANDGFLVGDGLSIFHTIDGGQSWRQQSSGMSGSLSWYGICATDARHATIVGNTGVILQTGDAGATWVPQYSGTGSDLFAIVAFDSNNAVAAGGDVHSNTSRVLLRTTTMSSMPVLTKRRTQIDFGMVTLGTTAVDSFTIVNTGTADLVIKNAYTGDVQFTVRPLTAMIASGDSAHFVVQFHPVTVTPSSAPAYLFFIGAGSPDSVRLLGRGAGGPVPAYGKPLDFGYVRIGKTVVDSVKIWNRGDRPLAFSGITVSDTAFAVAAAPAAIAPGDSGWVKIRFFANPLLPDTAQLRLAQVVFRHNGPTSPDSVMLTGHGVAPMLNLHAFDFGTVGFGEQKTDTAVMGNSVAQMVNIDSMHLTGSRFHVHVWKHTVMLYDTTRILITFAPDTTASLTGMLVVFHAPYGDPDTVLLSGAGGVQPIQISHDTINFGTVPVKSVRVDSFIVHNFGTTPYIATDARTDDQAFTVEFPSFGVAAGTSRVIHVRFAPTVVGSYSKLVVIDDNSSYSPHVVHLFANALTGVDDAGVRPASALMIAAYPNPVVDRAVFMVSIPADAPATVKIYSMLGACVATVRDESLAAGTHVIESALAGLPAGMYRAELRAGPFAASAPVVVVR